MNSDKKIVDIALKYGYESPNAFTRAFRNIHRVNPSKIRSGEVTLSSYKRVFFPLDNKGEEKMDYKIIESPQFNIAGKSKHFGFDEFIKEGPKFWKKYVGSNDYLELYSLNAGKPGPKTSAPLLSVYFPKEDGKRDEFVDVLGLEITTEMNLSEFETYSIPSATYAEFNCVYKSSMKTNRYIYGEWFASTGYERDANKPDVVAYFPIPFRPMSEMRVRWWIPVIGKQ